MAQRTANKSRLGALPWIAPALVMILVFVVWPALKCFALLSKKLALQVL